MSSIQYNLINKFSAFFKDNNLHDSHHQFLLAVSGGIDSVVLCELSKQAGLKFSIAHCNFGLRGEESERDEKFVRGLGEKYGVGVHVKSFDTSTYAKEEKLSVQEAARELRYQWFEELRKEKGLSYTLLAHHANDNIETVLMNFFRGTGLEGLTGMDVHSSYSHCLRPMLSFRREEIEAFAKENGLEWVEDSSNASNKYTRNFFRNELLPQLKKIYPDVENNLQDNIKRFNKTNLLYRKLVDDFKRKLCKYERVEVRIPVKQLIQWANTSLIYEIIKEYHFKEKQVDEVMKLADSESGKFIENAEYRLIKHRNWFIVTKKKVGGSTVAIDEYEKEVVFECGRLELKQVSIDQFKLDKNNSVAQLDAKEIEFPLLLRRWKQGDYFYPLGLRKKKKIARFLIDQKMPLHQKENVWVIESNKKIIWIVGQRINDRFKVSDSTKDVLIITHQL
jgi:tRNA(Ile)-lysidine synthase